MSFSVDQMIPPTRVARLLGVQVGTLAAWRRKGFGPRWYRIGRKIGYTESDLHSWVITKASSAHNSPAASAGGADHDRQEARK
jgi:hypothetical protein